MFSAILEGPGRQVTLNFKPDQLPIPRTAAWYIAASSPCLLFLVNNATVPYLETSAPQGASHSTTKLIDSIAYIFLTPIPSAMFFHCVKQILHWTPTSLLSITPASFYSNFSDAFQILRNLVMSFFYLKPTMGSFVLLLLLLLSHFSHVRLCATP